MWCNLKKIKRLFFPITSFLLLLLGILFANNFVFLFSRFFNPFSEALGNGNSYAESQKDNAGKSVYEIWWPGFNYSNKITHSDKEKYDEKNPRLRGNAQGIIDKLDYVKSLNVDYLWITPFFQSPQLDNGYDVADFYNVDNLFGVNSDFQQLLKKAHKKDLKILIDLVMNHTSRENPWFLWASGHSVSSSPFWKKEMYAKFIKNNNKPQGGDFEFPQFDEIPKKEIQNYYQDYYWFWKKEIKDIKKFDQEIKGKKQSEAYPPFFHDNGLNDNIGNDDYIKLVKKGLFLNFLKTNAAVFSENNKYFPYSLVDSYKPFNKETNPYYLHTFSDFQPDLNWNNPNVRKEMEKITNFYIKGKNWLKGEKVDGFRFDAVTLISKFGRKNDKDNKYLGYYDPHNELLVPSLNLDKYLGNFKDATYGPPNLFTVGELSQASADDKEATAKNTKVAREMFTTAYLPLDTLWNFNLKSNGHAFKPLKGSVPTSKKNLGDFFNEFLKDSYFSSQIFGNNSALIAENHDQPRSVSRFVDIHTDDPFVLKTFERLLSERYDDFKDQHKYFSHYPNHINNVDFQNKVFPRAKALATFKFLQPGISFIYAGQEYSHDNYPFYFEERKKTIYDPRFRDSMDLQTKSWLLKNRPYESFIPPWHFSDTENLFAKTTLRSITNVGREHARTPIQWSGKNNAGWGRVSFFDQKNSNNYDNIPYFKKGFYYLKNDDYKNGLKNFDEINKISSKTISLAVGVSKQFIQKRSIFVNKINGEKQFLYTPASISNDVAPLLLNPHYTKINVSSQEHDSNSPLNYYRQLLKLHNNPELKNFFRKGKLTPLVEGRDFKVVNYVKNYPDEKPTIAAYFLKYQNKRLLVMTELGNKKTIIKMSGLNPLNQVQSMSFNGQYLDKYHYLFNDAASLLQTFVISHLFDFIFLITSFFSLVILVRYLIWVQKV